MPRLCDTPATTEFIGKGLGESTAEVLREFLGLEEAAMQALAAEGVIAGAELGG